MTTATAHGVREALRDQELRRERVAKEPKSLPNALESVMAKDAKTFERDARKYQRATTRSEKITTKMEFYSKAENNGRYPVGVKPFKLSEKSVEFEAPFSKAVGAVGDIHIRIQEGANLRQAWAALHYGYTLARDQIESEAAAEFLAKTKPGASKDALLTLLAATVTKYEADRAAGADVGMDAVERLPIPDLLVAKKRQELPSTLQL